MVPAGMRSCAGAFGDGTVNTKVKGQSSLQVRWGIVTSFIFGCVGLVVGSTVPGGMQGISVQAALLFGVVMAVVAFLPGNLVGRTLAELRARQQP